MRIIINANQSRLEEAGRKEMVFVGPTLKAVGCMCVHTQGHTCTYMHIHSMHSCTCARAHTGQASGSGQMGRSQCSVVEGGLQGGHSLTGRAASRRTQALHSSALLECIFPFITMCTHDLTCSTAAGNLDLDGLGQN